MRPSYRQLIAEHASIEARADALIQALENEAVLASDLGAQLFALAALVNEHIAIERVYIGSLDMARLGEPWKRTWVDGHTAFSRLCADWETFLNSWDVSSIGADRAGFRSSANAILGRLRDRLDAETQSFYAAALQTGAIALR